VDHECQVVVFCNKQWGTGMQSNNEEKSPRWGLLVANLGTPASPDRRGWRGFCGNSCPIRGWWICRDGCGCLLNLVIIPLRSALCCGLSHDLVEGRLPLLLTQRLVAG
jgi:hypothetical protein